MSIPPGLKLDERDLQDFSNIITRNENGFSEGQLHTLIHFVQKFLQPGVLENIALNNPRELIYIFKLAHQLKAILNGMLKEQLSDDSSASERAEHRFKKMLINVLLLLVEMLIYRIEVIAGIQNIPLKTPKTSDSDPPPIVSKEIPGQTNG